MWSIPKTLSNVVDPDPEDVSLTANWLSRMGQDRIFTQTKIIRQQHASFSQYCWMGVHQPIKVKRTMQRKGYRSGYQQTDAGFETANTLADRHPWSKGKVLHVAKGSQILMLMHTVWEFMKSCVLVVLRLLKQKGTQHDRMLIVWFKTIWTTKCLNDKGLE